MSGRLGVEKNVSSKPLVSVIVPTFDSMTGTKNIGRTIESIIDQTYQSIEILVIDNFSSDATYEICKNYSIRFFRLKGNRSEARNYGISRMRGDYALFVDSDHILTPKVVEDCVNQALCFAADCVVVPVEFISDKKCFLDCSRMRNLEYDLGIGTRTYILFYSRSIIRNIWYPESVELGEDAVFSSEVLMKKPRVSRIRSVIYHIEDGTVKNLISRSWNYGKKFRFTISKIGLRSSSTFILDLSPLNIRKLAKLGMVVSNDSISLIAIFHFLFYSLLKHLSFGISYCLSLLERI